jgi:hypothetical protein
MSDSTRLRRQVEGLEKYGAIQLGDGDNLPDALELAKAVLSLAAERDALRAENGRLRDATPYVLPMPSGHYGVCIGGRWDGWLMRRHPDGQWVTDCKLERRSPSEGAEHE